MTIADIIPGVLVPCNDWSVDELDLSVDPNGSIEGNVELGTIVGVVVVGTKVGLHDGSIVGTIYG